MKDLVYPNWRYIGSKTNHLQQLTKILESLNYSSVVDLFGGSGVMSYYFFTKRKSVWYNDLLTSTMHMVKAQLLGYKTLDGRIFECLTDSDPVTLYDISETYFSHYFTLEENQLIDRIMSNLIELYPDQNSISRNLILYCIAQTCIQKQGKGTFHDNTMNRRRNSSNPQATWNQPIHELFEIARLDLNSFINFKTELQQEQIVFSTKSDREIYEEDNLSEWDLIYADPPFLGSTSNYFGNYVYSYHYIEFLFNYPNIDTENRQLSTKLNKPTQKHPLFIENRNWIQPEFVLDSFDLLASHSQNSKLVISYRSDALLTSDQITNVLENYFDDVALYSLNTKNGNYQDYLFVAQ